MTRVALPNFNSHQRAKNVSISSAAIDSNRARHLVERFCISRQQQDPAIAATGVCGTEKTRSASARIGFESYPRAFDLVAVIEGNNGSRCHPSGDGERSRLEPLLNSLAR
jgi:hypothetical protein